MILPGLYVHIPFCKRKCNYCDFYFTTSLKYQKEFCEALLLEITLHSKGNRFPLKEFDSVYFGGGTPSVLGVKNIERILGHIRSSFKIDPRAEVTLEANPDSVDKASLLAYKKMGINRLSLGVQSLDDSLLGWMNRGHCRDQAIRAIDNVRETGFEKWSVDLLHSIPGDSLTNYEKNLQKLLALDVPHISVYSLTVEEGTPLAKAIQLGEGKEVPDSESAEYMRLTQEVLRRNHFDHS